MAEGGYSEGVPYRVERSNPNHGGNDAWPWAVVDTVDDSPMALCMTQADAGAIKNLLNADEI